MPAIMWRGCPDSGWAVATTNGTPKAVRASGWKTELSRWSAHEYATYVNNAAEATAQRSDEYEE